jgi:predicted RecB family nuclease
MPQASPGIFRLSKSKYLSGLQCQKRLYLEIHAPTLASAPDEQTQAILDMGTEVGELARRRFPGGVLVTADHRHPTEALRQTAALLADPAVSAIFEGALEYDRVLVRVDILERVASASGGPDAWRLIEVKSSSRTKDVHISDLAIQAHVLRRAGLSLDGTWLMHINTQYVYPGGPLDVTQLFSLQDLSAQVAALEPDVAPRLARMKTMLQAPLPPAIEPGSHCHQPYDCPFWDHCTKEKPARWIYHLPGNAQTVERLARQGVETIDAIPPDVKLTSLQRRVKDDVEWVDARLTDALSSVRFPVHHLDFETFMPAIPKFPMTRPYQTIPTQWSNHIEMEGGQVRHEAYLCRDPDDPREEFAVTLLESLGREGSICVYSDYERTVLQRLADALPSLRADLTQAMARLWDLLTIVKAHYYHPAFAGSFSIKSVLPALVPDLSYADLEIREGGTAARAYQQMVFEETDWVEKERLRDALLQYCERDTLAMVAVRKALAARAMEARHD